MEQKSNEEKSRSAGSKRFWINVREFLRQLNRKRWFWAIVGAFAGFLVSFICTPRATRWRDGLYGLREPQYISFDRFSISVFNKEAAFLRRFVLPAVAQVDTAVLFDEGPSGRKKLFVTTKTGGILLLNPYRDTTIDKVPLAPFYVDSVLKEVGLPQKFCFTIYRVMVEDLVGNDGRPEILFLGGDFQQGYITQILLLDAKGNPMGRYWTFGSTSGILSEDMDKDGNKEIIAYGVNNPITYLERPNDPTDYCHVIFCLSSKDLSGQSPDGVFPNLVRGHEKWYYLCDTGKIVVDSTNNPQFRDMDGDGKLELVFYVEVTPSNGNDCVVFVLDENGNVKHKWLSDEYIAHRGHRDIPILKKVVPTDRGYVSVDVEGG